MMMTMTNTALVEASISGLTTTSRQHSATPNDSSETLKPWGPGPYCGAGHHPSTLCWVTMHLSLPNPKNVMSYKTEVKGILPPSHRSTARVVLFSAVSVCVFVCLSVNTITPEPLEILSHNFHISEKTLQCSVVYDGIVCFRLCEYPAPDGGPLTVHEYTRQIIEQNVGSSWRLIALCLTYDVVRQQTTCRFENFVSGSQCRIWRENCKFYVWPTTAVRPNYSVELRRRSLSLIPPRHVCFRCRK